MPDPSKRSPVKHSLGDAEVAAKKKERNKQKKKQKKNKKRKSRAEGGVEHDDDDDDDDVKSGAARKMQASGGGESRKNSPTKTPTQKLPAVALQQSSASPKKNQKKDKKSSTKKEKNDQEDDHDHNNVPNNNNPLLEAHTKFLTTQCTPQERDNFFSNTLVDADRRAELWMEQADVGEALVNQYAWAIPDARALRILQQFSPLIEIGCGSNAYWARLLAAQQQQNIDIVAYDMFPEQGGQIDPNNDEDGGGGGGKSKEKKRKRKSKSGKDDITSFQVLKGGPEVLASKKVREEDRTLFLCYCDEDILQQPTTTENGNDDGNDDDNEEEDDNEDNDNDDDDDSQPDERRTSLGIECLRHYTGDYVIHVGELFGDTLSMDQAPWGRSSSMDFQQHLAASFHCLLKAKLPNWLHVRDTISVWKRSEICPIVFAADSEDEDDAEEDDEVEYRHIPVSERLPVDVAAPCLAHLLYPAIQGQSPYDKKKAPTSTTSSSHNDSTGSGRAKKKQKTQPLPKTPPPSATADSSTSSNDEENEGRRLDEDEFLLQRKHSTSSSRAKTQATADGNSGSEDSGWEVQW